MKSTFWIGLALVGAAQATDWSQTALASQYRAGLDADFGDVNLVGTHNSYATLDSFPSRFQDFVKDLRDDGDVCFFGQCIEGFLVAENQYISMSEQMNLGVRHINLDIHYVPELADDGPLRVCHASNQLNGFCQQAQDEVRLDLCSSLLDFPDYGAHRGCTSTSFTVKSQLTVLSDWLSSADADEFIYIDIEDRVSEETGCVNVEELNNVFESVFGDMIYTPNKLAQYTESTGKVWPTIREMLSSGARVFVSSTCNFGNSVIHDITTLSSNVNGRQDIGFTQLDPTTCNGYSGGRLVVRESALEADLTLDDKNFAFSAEDVMRSRDDVQSVMECGFTTAFDHMDADRSEWSVWSWVQDVSPINSCSASCVVQNADGRWDNGDCSQELLSACVSDTDSESWTLSDSSSDHSNAGSSCPTGTSLGLPATSKQNTILREVSAGQEVWLRQIETVTCGEVPASDDDDNNGNDDDVADPTTPGDDTGDDGGDGGDGGSASTAFLSSGAMVVALAFHMIMM
eukprot:Clim_evm101s210 gene=Clim_evmTU101s210